MGPGHIGWHQQPQQNYSLWSCCRQPRDKWYFSQGVQILFLNCWRSSLEHNHRPAEVRNFSSEIPQVGESLGWNSFVWHFSFLKVPPSQKQESSIKVADQKADYGRVKVTVWGAISKMWAIDQQSQWCWGIPKFKNIKSQVCYSQISSFYGLSVSTGIC